MILSKETIEEINDTIENYDLEEEYSTGHVFEIEVGTIILCITFSLWANLHEEYMVHDEVPPPNVENLSYFEFNSAEITEITAYNEDGDEVEIENLNELKY